MLIVVLNGHDVLYYPTITCFHIFCLEFERICVLIVFELASSVRDHRFQPCAGQNKDDKIYICCLR